MSVKKNPGPARPSLVYCVLFFDAMRFKNLFVYRLDAKCKLDAQDLEKSLAGHALQPCNSFEMESRGWTGRRQQEPFYMR